MSDQPGARPESGQPESGQPESGRPQSGRPGGSTPPGLEPPRFAPPYGTQVPAAPHYGQGGYGQESHGQNTYGQPGRYGDSYGQPPRPYAQQSSPYGQPPGPYAQQGYYGMQAEPKTLSIASMVCGIASVIMGWLLLPQIAAIITGHMALKREPAGKGMSIAGLVLGYLCLLGYGAFWLLAIIGLAIARSSSGPTYTF